MLERFEKSMQIAVDGIPTIYESSRAAGELSATRSESYMDAIERAQMALVKGDLKSASDYIMKARYSRYELNEQVTSIISRGELSWKPKEQN